MVTGVYESKTRFVLHSFPFRTLVTAPTENITTMLSSTKKTPLSFSQAFANEEDEGGATPTVITPPSCGRKFESSADQWVQASCALRDNPSLVTPRVLIKALQNQPPVHVIRFMLSVNPKAATVPKQGPTPLQVAVQYNASLEVVETLLEACPFALCVTNPQHAEDPLSYAKRHRKHDKKLLELLSRPLSFWVSKRNRDPNASITSFREDRVPPPSAVDKQDIYNVKVLCAQVLKGHKKLAKQLVKCQEQLETSKFDKTEILKELHEQQQHHFYRQLIALDMKEKAMRAHANKMEERCMNQCELKVKGWQKGMESWKSSTEAKMKEWQVLLEHEVKINAHFRNDLGEWMEEQGPIETFMFATPLGELNEDAPLCPKEVVELGHVKKRPWKPFFKHWDRIRLEDEDVG
jgi:hypothetical protein